VAIGAAKSVPIAGTYHQAPVVAVERGLRGAPPSEARRHDAGGFFETGDDGAYAIVATILVHAASLSAVELAAPFLLRGAVTEQAGPAGGAIGIGAANFLTVVEVGLADFSLVGRDDASGFGALLTDCTVVTVVVRFAGVGDLRHFRISRFIGIGGDLGVGTHLSVEDIAQIVDRATRTSEADDTREQHHGTKTSRQRHGPNDTRRWSNRQRPQIRG